MAPPPPEIFPKNPPSPFRRCLMIPYESMFLDENFDRERIKGYLSVTHPHQIKQLVMDVMEYIIHDTNLNLCPTEYDGFSVDLDEDDIRIDFIGEKDTFSAFLDHRPYWEIFEHLSDKFNKSLRKYEIPNVCFQRIDFETFSRICDLNDDNCNYTYWNSKEEHEKTLFDYLTDGDTEPLIEIYTETVKNEKDKFWFGKFMELFPTKEQFTKYFDHCVKNETSISTEDIQIF